MISLDLPPESEALTRDAARAATLAAARAFGLGGDTWLISRPSGTGPAARTLTPLGHVAGLVFRQRPGPLAPAGGGTPVLADLWRAILDTGDILDADEDDTGLDARPGDVITSQADSAYTFGLASLEPWYADGEYKRCELERRR
jgi:hypothetical protein